MTSSGSSRFPFSGWMCTLFLFVFIRTSEPQSFTGCSNATKNPDTGGSCTFETNWCGYTNVKDDNLDWEKDSYRRKDYISVKMAGQDAGSYAILASPVFCATGSEMSALSFDYAMGFSNRCRLSIDLVVGTKKIRIWQTKNGSGYRTFKQESSIYFRCSSDHFQIYFVGEKLTTEPCGFYDDEIELDNIVYSIYSWSSPTTTTCPASAANTTTARAAATTTTTTRRASTTILSKTTQNHSVTGTH